MELHNSVFMKTQVRRLAKLTSNTNLLEDYKERLIHEYRSMGCFLTTPIKFLQGI